MGLDDIFKPRPPKPPVPTTRVVAAIVKQGGVNATLRTDSGAIYMAVSSDPAPDKFNLAFTIKATDTGGATLDLMKDEFRAWSGRVVLDPVLGTGFELWPVKPPLPPMLPPDVLTPIRGAMWTVRWNGPMGPRPGQPTNVLAMDFYEHYGPDDRKRMVDIYKSRGYTHAVTGPIIAGGYRDGMWPAVSSFGQSWWDHYLDCMQEWRDAGIVPVHFMSPDNWSLERCKNELSPYYLQERAQALLPIKVPHGWEPERYGTSSEEWARWGDWGAEVSASGSLMFIHSVCDVGAMVGAEDNGKDLGGRWRVVAPHFHGWLIQLCGYVDAMGERDPAKKAAMLAAWEVNYPAHVRDQCRRFREGYANWPTFSKWGTGTPMKVYMAEYASYPFFWDGGITEAEIQRYGDIAIVNGADGYLDGGTVPVPFRG